MKQKASAKRILIALLAAAVLTAVAASGWLASWNNTMTDSLLQRAKVTDGEIVVIGIDQRALEELGPFPWPREYMADAISFLNSDPDNRSGVTGVYQTPQGYYVDDADVEAFDKHFAPKQKLKLPGQLF